MISNIAEQKSRVREFKHKKVAIAGHRENGQHKSDFKMVYLSLQILYLILISFYSFHVGTECEESRAYTDAIQQAREAFDMGTELGFNMKILDIGGGYPGNTSSEPLFKQV